MEMLLKCAWRLISYIAFCSHLEPWLMIIDLFRPFIGYKDIKLVHREPRRVSLQIYLLLFSFFTFFPPWVLTTEIPLTFVCEISIQHCFLIFLFLLIALTKREVVNCLPCCHPLFFFFVCVSVCASTSTFLFYFSCYCIDKMRSC